MEHHFGKYQNNASKWWVWGTVWKMTQKFRWLKSDCNSSRMEQFSRWLSWWTDPSKSLSLKFWGNKQWNRFQFPSNFTLSCSMWQCVIGKCVSFGMEPEKINEPVSTYPKHRLKGSLAAGTTETFHVQQSLKEPLRFCNHLGEDCQIDWTSVWWGAQLPTNVSIYRAIVPHATCCKWVVPIEAMVAKLNGLSTASCYRCQCILKVGSCRVLIRLIISQGWTCLHTLRQSYAGIPVSNFAYRCRLLTGPRWFFGFNLALVAISIPIFGVKSLLKAWGLCTRMLTVRGSLPWK